MLGMAIGRFLFIHKQDSLKKSQIKTYNSDIKFKLQNNNDIKSTNRKTDLHNNLLIWVKGMLRTKYLNLFPLN